VQGGTPLVIALFVTIGLVLGLGLEGVGIGYVAGGLLITGAWAVSTWRRERARVRLTATGTILRGSVLYGLTGLLSQVFYKADVLLLSAMATMPQVGIYAAGYKLLDLAYKIPILGARVVAPAMFQQNDRDARSYRASADAYLRLNAVAGLMLGVACYPSADWLVALLFGDAFAQAGVVLRILSASFALKFLATTLQTVLTTRGQHRMRTGALAATTAAGVVCHLVLIPQYGAVGAAITVVGMEAALTVVYLIGIGDTALRGLLAARAAVAVAAAVAATALPLALGLHGPAASAGGVLAFALALVGTGYVRRDEVRNLWNGIVARRVRVAAGTD
jgi:O-antigen/teichoic acid export membrane protein